MVDETSKMVTELLEKQLQLLSECSEKSDGVILATLSSAMIGIARLLIGD